MKQKFFSNIRGDIFGGITAGIVALPLALAFGVASGMGAIAGVYGAIAVGLIAALFGGTPSQVSGPTGPMTVVTASLAVGLGGNPVALFAAVILAGFFQILMGIFKIGKYISYIPYPVVSGFMSGIGIIIVILQLFPFLGFSPSAKILDALSGLPGAIAGANWQAAAIGALTIAIIYIFPRITKTVPATLVALFVGTITAVALKLDIPNIGQIPSGFPKLSAPMIGISDLTIIIVPALTLAALGAIDSLLTSLVADNLTKTHHDSNKELIGQGLGNMLAGFIGGIPGAGATMRTVVNIKSGGKTGLSGAIHALFLLAVLLGLGTFAAKIPMAVLAGILITVGIGIIDYKGLKHIAFIPKADSFVMITVILLTVFVDLLQAVAVGLVISSLLFMKKISSILEKKAMPVLINDFNEANGVESLEEITVKGLNKKVFVQHLDGPLFFGFAIPFQKMASDLTGKKAIILHMEKVPYVDQSGLYALEEVALQLKEKGIPLLITGIQEQPLMLMKKIKLVPDTIPEENIMSSIPEAASMISSKRFNELITKELIKGVADD